MTSQQRSTLPEKRTPQVRSADALRDLLWKQIEGLAAGKVDPNNARVVAQVSIAILKSVEVEMEFREQQLRLKEGGVRPEYELGCLPLAPEESK